MPSIPLYPPTPSRTAPPTQPPNPLPQLLHTPLGLALLEIQGALNLPLPSSDAAAAADATTIGRLVFPLLPPSSSSSADGEGEAAVGAQEGPWMKRVWLYVGAHQRLAGEVRRLAVPVGVVVRAEHRGEEEEDGTGEAVMVREVVRWKVFFGGRPEFV